ncbi:MAG: DUF5702 domain-containing protein [Emergencia sp.]
MHLHRAGIADGRRGSVTIFVCLFFVTLVWAISVFTGAARQNAVNSSVRALSALWAESVLAEYDLNLQRRYNLFGFYGYPADVTEKLDFYASQTFEEKKYIQYEGSSCDLYDYSLVNVDLLREQLVAAGKLAFTEDFIAPEKEITPVEKAEETAEKEYSGENIFDSLPSEGTSRAYSADQLKDLVMDAQSAADIIDKTGDSWALNQYIFSYFKHLRCERNLGETFLQREIEYMICGNRSDTANTKGVRNRIIAIREGPNLACISSSASMCAKTAAAAEILTPGPAAAATSEALKAAWALAESINDYRLLAAGHRVPMVKTESMWATDLESVLADREEGCIFTGIDEGENYEDYLRLFTYTMDERVLILRIMDLIQINMRYLYYDSFLLREYNGGVKFIMKVNGKEHEVARTY